MLPMPGSFTGTQPPSHLVLRPLHVRVKPPKIYIAVLGCPPPEPGLWGSQRTSLWGDAAAGASYPLPHHSGHCVFVSLNCPVAPLSLAHRGGCAIWLAGASGRKGHQVLLLVYNLQLQLWPGRRAQFPRPRLRQAAEGCRASARAAGLGGFLETFLPHHLSSGFREK